MELRALRRRVVACHDKILGSRETTGIGSDDALSCMSLYWQLRK